MPFITEEIWQRVAPLASCPGPSVMLASYPRASEFAPDLEAEREVQWIQRLVFAVRQIKGEIGIDLTRPVPVLLRGASRADRALIERHRVHLDRLAGLASLTLLEDGDPAPQAATALAGELTVLVPMAGLIDAAAEADRLA
jgi:valyl-tRNA synthetase